MSNAYECDGCGDFGNGVSWGSARTSVGEGVNKYDDLCADCARAVRELLENQ
jgi:hypothetical protein